MKLTIHNKIKNSITAYRIVIGSKRAKELGLAEENGHTIVPIKTQNGILLIPVHNSHGTLSYKDCSTTIFSYQDRIFFGEISGLPSTLTWHSKSIQSAEEAFHSTVDSALL